MRSNAVPVFLSLLLLVAASVTALLSYRYVQVTGEAKALQSRLLDLNRKRQLSSNFGRQLIAYARQDSSILPTLQAAGIIRINSTNAPAALPEGESSTDSPEIPSIDAPSGL